MDKTKIIKIVIAIIIAICAICYYIFNSNNDDNYEEVLNKNVVVEKVDEKIDEKESKIKVYVTGEVKSPGVIELNEGDRIEDAVENAGGITAEANLKNINLAYEVSDGEKIYIPNLNEIEEEVVQESLNSNSETKTSKININKANVSELKNVPGIGESTAEKIVNYREQNGKFSKVEDIKNVSGIGDNKYEKMKDFICTK